MCCFANLIHDACAKAERLVSHWWRTRPVNHSEKSRHRCGCVGHAGADRRSRRRTRTTTASTSSRIRKRGGASCGVVEAERTADGARSVVRGSDGLVADVDLARARATPCWTAPVQVTYYGQHPQSDGEPVESACCILKNSVLRRFRQTRLHRAGRPRGARRATRKRARAAAARRARRPRRRRARPPCEAGWGRRASLRTTPKQRLRVPRSLRPYPAQAARPSPHHRRRRGRNLGRVLVDVRPDAPSFRALIRDLEEGLQFVLSRPEPRKRAPLLIQQIRAHPATSAPAPVLWERRRRSSDNSTCSN